MTPRLNPERDSRKRFKQPPPAMPAPGESMSSRALPARRRPGGRTHTPEAQLLALSRRVHVAELTVRGQTRDAIAIALGVSPSTIKQDLSIIKADWRELEVQHFEEHVNVQLRKLDAVEREAWAAWAASKLPAKTTTLAEDGDGETTAKIETKEQVGDPQFLTIIDRCIGRRCSLLGLNAPKKSEVSASVDVNTNVNLTMPRREQMRDAVMQRLTPAMKALLVPSDN